MVPSLKTNSLGSQALSKPSTGLLSSHLCYMCVGPEHTQIVLRLEREAATCCRRVDFSGVHLRTKCKPCCLKDRHGTGLVLVLGTMVGIVVFYSYALALPTLMKCKKTKSSDQEAKRAANRK